MLMGISSWAQDREAYAVVSLDGKTVQLFYDTNKIENQGIEINSYYYQSATKIVIDESLSEYHPESIFDWFQMANDLESISGLQYLNTDKVKGMAYLFGRCSKLTELDLSNFNTSNVTSMYRMFYECSSLRNLNIRHFDTSNVKDMFGMFYSCSSLTNLDLSGWDTNQVTTMEGMFCDCTSLKTINLSGWGNANVTDMHYMFEGCTALTDVNLKNFKTPSLIRSWYMFAFCSSLESLDLSSFNTPNLTSMWRMFLNCTSLKSVDLSNFNTTEVTTLEGTFHGCTSLESVDLSSFNVQKVLSMKYTFYGCTSLKTIYASDLWKLRPPKSGADEMFKDCFNLIGGMGTTYDTKRTSHTFARFDNPPSSPGYLTKKEVDVVKEKSSIIEYFFDNDPGYGKALRVQNVKEGENRLAIDLSGLATGAHLFAVRSLDKEGKWSSTIIRPLYVYRKTAGVVALEYYFDNADPGQGKAHQVALPENGSSQFAFEVSLEGLSVGEHVLNVRAKDCNGLWAATTSQSFLLTDNASGIGLIMSNEDGSAQMFTIGGYRTIKQQRGPVIIKSKNGKTKKAIVR